MGNYEDQSNGYCHTAPRDKKNQYKLVFWCFTWALTWVAATRVAVSDWGPKPALPIICALVTLVMGLGLFTAYRRYLKDADELLRKIELEALALSVGVGIIGGCFYKLLHDAEIITILQPFSATILLICFAYAVGTVLGHRRFS